MNIKQYEQDKKNSNNPLKFNNVLDQMLEGKEGNMSIECARRGTRKGEYSEGVKYENLQLEYYYAPVLGGELAVALKLAETDKAFLLYSGLCLYTKTATT